MKNAVAAAPARPVHTRWRSGRPAANSNRNTLPQMTRAVPRSFWSSTTPATTATSGPSGRKASRGRWRCFHGRERIAAAAADREQLRELGRLKGDRTEIDPPGGAVERGAERRVQREEHHGQQREEHRDRRPSPERVREPRRHHQADHARRRVERLAVEVPEARPVPLDRGDRPGRKDHHEADHREESGRREQEREVPTREGRRCRRGAHQVGRPDESEMGARRWRGSVRRRAIVRSATGARLRAQRPRRRREPVPALGVVRELIPARARRRQQDGVAPGAAAPKASRTASSIDPAMAVGTDPSNTLDDIRGRLADRDHGPEASRVSPERREIHSLRAAARDQDGVAGAVDRGGGGVDVRGLRVVDEPNPVDGRDDLTAVGPRTEPGERGRHGGGCDPVGERDGRRGGRVLAISRPAPPSIRPEPVRCRPRGRRARRPRSRPRPRRAVPSRNQRSAHVALEEISAATGSSRLPMCTSVPDLPRVDALLRLDVGLERAVPVEVIGRDVQQDRDRWDGTTPGAPAGSSTPPRRRRRAPRVPPPGRTGRCCRTRARRVPRLADRPRSSTSRSSCRSFP